MPMQHIASLWQCGSLSIPGQTPTHPHSLHPPFPVPSPPSVVSFYLSEK